MQVRKAPKLLVSNKEMAPKVLHHSLDLTLGLRSGRFAGLGFKTVESGHGQKAVVESDFPFTRTFNHGWFLILHQYLCRYVTKVLKRANNGLKRVVGIQAERCLNVHDTDMAQFAYTE